MKVYIIRDTEDNTIDAVCSSQQRAEEVMVERQLNDRYHEITVWEVE